MRNDHFNIGDDTPEMIQQGIDFTADIATMAAKRKMSPNALVIAFANGLACHIATAATIHHIMGGMSVGEAATLMEDGWPALSEDIIHNARHKFYIGMADLPACLKDFNEKHPDNKLTDEEMDGKGL